MGAAELIRKRPEPPDQEGVDDSKKKDQRPDEVERMDFDPVLQALRDALAGVVVALKIGREIRFARARIKCGCKARSGKEHKKDACKDCQLRCYSHQ